ncbi:MAG: fatty acid oxidation complex subunit alpha FadB [Pseudomonadota bacterium]
MIFQGQSISCQLLADGIANVCFDLKDESVNKFDRATLDELSQTIDALSSRDDVKGAIVSSAKPVFIVGADITEFLGLFNESREKLLEWVADANRLFNRFEDLPFPTIAAINGIALGGGMEMCLACDFRVASTQAKVGLPEVKLGIIPGFGGTTRLPRLVGADNAIEWICSGQENKAPAALKVGAVDAVVEPELLEKAATEMLKQAIAGDLNWKQRREQKQSPLKLDKTESLMVFSTSKAFIASKAGPNYPAPLAAIDVIEKGARLGRDEALKVEGEAFVTVAKSPQAESLISIFLNDQVVKKKAKVATKAAKKPIASAAVLGAGIMGGGIAYQSASKGVPIVMKDIQQDALDLGMSEAFKLLNKGVQRGKVTTEKMAKTLNAITPTLSYEPVKTTDLIVEAVVENPKVKDAVLTELEGLVSEDTILTSNTSTISIDLLAKNLKRPENFCGMHFFNPVHKMPLVEVIRGEKTSDETVAAVVAYASQLGKSPIVVNDCPGFLVNRVLFPYFNAFSLLVRDGADFQQVDKVMERFGWPMGPAYLLDVVGIDTGQHASQVMADGFPDRMKKDARDSLDVLFEEKRYGQKNGVGFYQYKLDKKGRPKKSVDEKIYDLIAPVAAERKEFDKQDIIYRMMIPMIIETIRCVEEKIVASVQEADMGLVYGIGFPPFRGGALKYVDSIGIDKFCEIADQYAHLGNLYKPTEGMREMAKNGQSFYKG